MVKRVLSAENVELEHDQNSLELSFGTLDFAMDDRTDFSYRMEGLTKYGLTRQATILSFIEISLRATTYLRYVRDKSEVIGVIL